MLSCTSAKVDGNIKILNSIQSVYLYSTKSQQMSSQSTSIIQSNSSQLESKRQETRRRFDVCGSCVVRLQLFSLNKCFLGFMFHIVLVLKCKPILQPGILTALEEVFCSGLIWISLSVYPIWSPSLSGRKTLPQNDASLQGVTGFFPHTVTDYSIFFFRSSFSGFETHPCIFCHGSVNFPKLLPFEIWRLPCSCTFSVLQMVHSNGQWSVL